MGRPPHADRHLARPADHRGRGSGAVATAYTTRLGLGGSTFHLAESAAGAAETVFLGVFQKEALLALGGFDESMHRAQDWELNYRLRKSGRLIWFSPDLRVTYRPRSSFGALIKQMYETGRWRREVVRRYPDTASARYLAPPAAVVAIVAGLVGSLWPGGPGHAIPAAAGRLRRSRRLRRACGGRIRGRYAAASRWRRDCGCPWCSPRPTWPGGSASWPGCPMRIDFDIMS